MEKDEELKTIEKIVLTAIAAWTVGAIAIAFMLFDDLAKLEQNAKKAWFKLDAHLTKLADR